MFLLVCRWVGCKQIKNKHQKRGTRLKELTGCYAERIMAKRFRARSTGEEAALWYLISWSFVPQLNIRTTSVSVDG